MTNIAHLLKSVVNSYILFNLIWTPLVHAQSMQDALDQKTAAFNQFYNALSKTPNPTPSQVSQLKSQLLGPANAALNDSANAAAKSNLDKFNQDFDKAEKAAQSKMLKNMMDGVTDAKLKETIADAFKNAKNKKILPSTNASKGKNQIGIKSPKIPQSGVTPIEEEKPVEVIDGSKIPKEIEFKGPASPSKKITPALQ